MTDTEKIANLFGAMKKAAEIYAEFGGGVTVVQTIRVGETDIRVTVERDRGRVASWLAKVKRERE
jgi:hypothetical protein